MQARCSSVRECVCVCAKDRYGSWTIDHDGGMVDADGGDDGSMVTADSMSLLVSSASARSRQNVCVCVCVCACGR